MYGVWVTDLKTMGSNLREQVKLVFINGARSKPKRIVQGIQQGSVLGVHAFLGNDRWPTLQRISFTVCWRHKTHRQGWWFGWECTPHCTLCWPVKSTVFSQQIKVQFNKSNFMVLCWIQNITSQRYQLIQQGHITHSQRERPLSNFSLLYAVPSSTTTWYRTTTDSCCFKRRLSEF